MPARRALFWCLSAVLVASAVFVLSVRPGDAGRSTERRRVGGGFAGTARIYGPGRSRAPDADGAAAGLGPPARRFVAAFLRYEVGERPQAVRRALRRTSTPSFFSELAGAPTAVPGIAAPRAAVPGRLSLRVLVRRPPVALVSGDAHRAGGVEQFSFLFVKTGAGWRARGPGE